MKSKIIKTINISTIVIFLFVTVSALFVSDIPKASAATIVRDSSPSQNQYTHLPWCDYPYRCPKPGNDEPWIIDGEWKGLNSYNGNDIYACGAHTYHCDSGGGHGSGHGSWASPDDFYGGGWAYPGSPVSWPTNPPQLNAKKVSQNVYGNNGQSTNIIWGKNPPDNGCYGSPVKTEVINNKTYYGLGADTTLFRNVFTLSSSEFNDISSVTFKGVADDWMKVYINGNELAETSWTIGDINNIPVPKDRFQAGTNVIAIQASNKGYWWDDPTLGNFNEAGLYYKLTINTNGTPPPPPPSGTSSVSATPYCDDSESEAKISWTGSPNFVWGTPGFTLFVSQFDYEHYNQSEQEMEEGECYDFWYGGYSTSSAGSFTLDLPSGFLYKQLCKQGGHLQIKDVLPADWPKSLKLKYNTTYYVEVCGDYNAPGTHLGRFYTHFTAKDCGAATSTLIITKKQLNSDGTANKEDNTWEFSISGYPNTVPISISGDSSSGVSEAISNLTPGQYTITETGVSTGTLDDWDTEPPNRKITINIQTGLNPAIFTNIKKGGTSGSSWWPIWREVAP